MGVHIPRGEGQFLGLSWPFKSIGNLLWSRCCSIAVAFAAKRIVQSPITSCSRQDHSVCQTSAGSILKISGCRQCGQKGVLGLHSTDKVWYLWLPCYLCSCLYSASVSHALNVVYLDIKVAFRQLSFLESTMKQRCLSYPSRRITALHEHTGVQDHVGQTLHTTSGVRQGWTLVPVLFCV